MEVGSLFDGRYKIIKILGEGGMSRVYLGENIKLGTLWAIKEIKKTNDRKIDFYVEPNILKKLSHPALPRIFDIIESDEFLYIIVDYIEGDSLDKALINEGKFDEKTVLGWTRQICDVLLYLHNLKPNPVIYRDMKPANIILTKEGCIKLIDFGIAREFKSDSDSDTVYIGTRGYAAPEQYGSGQSSVTTDIYSLGVTMFRLITGKSFCEYNARNETAGFPEGVSEQIWKIIKKCTRLNPENRYQSVQEIIDEISLNEENINNTEVIGGNAQKETNFAYQARGRFKKLILTVWANPYFGCELAYLAAKSSEFSVLLIDLDLLAPTADLLLNVPKYPENIRRDNRINYSSLDILMDSVDKNYLTSDIICEASIKRKEPKNLYIVTGNYNLNNYEYYSDRNLVKLLDKAYQYFDITILLVNKSIYDSFTVISLLKSDYNIIPLRSDIDKLREFNAYVDFLKEKQHIPEGKNKFVIYGYDSNCLDRKLTNQVTGASCIGCIHKSEKREKSRNLKTPYVRRIEKSILNEYIEILSYFNIIPKSTFFRKLKEYCKDTYRSLRALVKFSKKTLRVRRSGNVSNN